MNTNSVLASILGLIVAACAITSAINDNKKEIKENFINVRRVATVDTQMISEDGTKQYSVTPDYNRMMNSYSAYRPGSSKEGYTAGSDGSMFPKTYGVANYQGMLSPRMGPAEGFRGNIRYNMPSHENMAVPKSPLDYGTMVEGFDDSNQQAMSGGGNRVEVVNALPVGNMTQMEDGSDTPKQFYMVDKFMYANAKSRLNALGDKLRGDIPIPPCKDKWFRPSVNPLRDLTEGSLAVIGGADNETARALESLKQAASGGTYTNYNLAQKMVAQEQDGSLQYSARAFI